MDTLKASVAILEAKAHKLEARVEDAEGRARRCNIRIVGFPEANLKVLHVGRSHFFQSSEAAWDWLERNDETGTPDSLHGEGGRRPRGTAEMHTAGRRSTRRSEEAE
ncbi:hypothetical protein NDU88_012201 [Pleurodeles waltl]|uniref:Uncharacterized protein n=1 Tax=Pleurodeles waltl TaxID=8319 RepID=A0AAV7R573_PLEWA|nr:hypothetical protein NDU88_012201 [Pleurodeles waltl]